MSSTTIFGGRRWCILSIHWPGRSARAARFSGRLSHFVSKRPIWLAEAAVPAIAWSLTTQRIAGSRHSLSAASGPTLPLQLVVSAFAPVDRRRFGHPASRSGRLQDAERYRGSAHVLPTPRCRGNTLAHAGPTAQEVSQLVVAAAIPPRRSSALQSKHRSTSALDAAVILLKSIVQIATCTMPHMAAKLGPDCPGIGIVAVRGDPIRDYAGPPLPIERRPWWRQGRDAHSASRQPRRQRDRSRDTDTANHRAPECMSRRRTSSGRLCLFVADGGSQPMPG